MFLHKYYNTLTDCISPIVCLVQSSMVVIELIRDTATQCNIILYMLFHCRNVSPTIIYCPFNFVELTELAELVRLHSVLLCLADLTGRKDIPNRELIVELQKMCKYKDIKVTLVSLNTTNTHTHTHTHTHRLCDYIIYSLF